MKTNWLEHCNSNVFMWFNNTLSHGLPISDYTLLLNAQMCDDKFQVNDFQYYQDASSGFTSHLLFYERHEIYFKSFAVLQKMSDFFIQNILLDVPNYYQTPEPSISTFWLNLYCYVWSM